MEAIRVRTDAAEEKEYECPVCGEICDFVYVNEYDGDKIVGCESCIHLRCACDELDNDGY